MSPSDFNSNDWISAQSDEETPISQLSGPMRASHPIFWLVLAVLAAGYMSLFVWSPLSEFSQSHWAMRIAGPGLIVLPFVPLILFATLARDLIAFRSVAVIYWLFLGCGGVVLNGMLTFNTVLDPERVRQNQLQDPKQHQDPRDMVRPGGLTQVAQVVLLTAGVVAIGLLCFTPSIRQIASRWLPFDPGSFPDTVAFATAIALSLGCVIPLLVLHEPPMLVLAEHAKDPINQKSIVQPELSDLYAQLLWMLPVTILAAGYPLVRGFRSSLKRLGLVTPTIWQLLIAVLAAGVFVVVMPQFEHLLDKIWRSLHWPTTDEAAYKELFGYAKTSAWAVAIAVTAGLGEEITFRGLLQPRLGLVGANLLFTAVHAPQYQLDGLISVFVIGLVLGYIRQRTNTTTSAIVHGLYDFMAVIALGS